MAATVYPATLETSRLKHFVDLSVMLQFVSLPGLPQSPNMFMKRSTVKLGFVVLREIWILLCSRSMVVLLYVGQHSSSSSEGFSLLRDHL